VFKNIALPILCLGLLSWTAGSRAATGDAAGCAAIRADRSSSPAEAAGEGSGSPQKKAAKPKKILFKSFRGVVEVEGHRHNSTADMTNFVETISGTIAFKGINDVVTESSGTLTYAMSGWNKNDTIPCGMCLHKVSGTVQASFEPAVSKMVGAAEAKQALPDEQKKEFKDAEFHLLALANFEFRISSYTTDCCGKVIAMPPGTYVQAMQPLVIPGNFQPFRFSAEIDGWSGDLLFTIKSFDGRSK